MQLRCSLVSPHREGRFRLGHLQRKPDITSPWIIELQLCLITSSRISYGHSIGSSSSTVFSPHQRLDAFALSVLVTAVNLKSYPTELFGVLMDVESLSSSFQFFFLLSFVLIAQNSIADSLVKSALCINSASTLI